MTFQRCSRIMLPSYVPVYADFAPFSQLFATNTGSPKEDVIALEDTNVPLLYRHTRRPVWGYAVLAGEAPGRRRYQFQDGQLRIIREGFYHLLEAVDEPLDVALRIANELESQVATADRRRKALKDNPKLIPFEDQIKAFIQIYPEGFETEEYQTVLRGRDAKRRLKKMRNQAIESAQNGLSEDTLRAALDTNDGAAFQAAVLEVLTATDLVTRTDLEPWRGMDETTALAVAKALYATCYSDNRADTVAQNFDAMRKAFGKETKVSWPALTSLPALIRPDEYVVVKASVFREQAKWMAPGMQLPTDSSGAIYARLLRIAESIRERLTKGELPPSDMMDVYEFIAVTMRPKGRKLIADMRKGNS